MRGRGIGLLAAGIGLLAGCDGPPRPCEDRDGDGYHALGQGCLWTRPGDCDDGDANLNPADADGDRYSTCEGDCDDGDATVHPGADDVPCDGGDRDCDGGESLAFLTVETAPADGAQDVHPLSFVYARVSAAGHHRAPALEDLALVVRDAGGQPVAGEAMPQTGPHGLLFHPDEVLATDATYEAELTVGVCEPKVWSFHTGAAGESVDPAPSLGGAFYLDHTSGSITEPWNMEWLILDIATDVHAALQIEAIDEDGGVLEAFYAPVFLHGGTMSQNFCVPTGRWGVDGPLDPLPHWSSPYIEAGPFDFHFTYEIEQDDWTEGVAYQAASRGTLRADGEAIEGLTMVEQVDMRFLDGVFAPNTACDLVSAGGQECTSCPGGEGPHCVQMRFELLEAPRRGVASEHPETGEALEALIEVTPEQAEAWAKAGLC